MTLGDRCNGGFFRTLADGGAATLSLTKIGNGTQILSGANSFTGPISVQGGVLNLTLANATTGSTTITAGKLLLSGSGTVNSTSGITVNGSGAGLVNTSAIAETPAINLIQGSSTERASLAQ